MNKLSANLTITDLQKLMKEIYSVVDDRMFSLPDLLSNHQRFTMRALKGIRKGDHEKIKINLAISISWLMTISNRLHIDVDDAIRERFPGTCSYCGKKPCACDVAKLNKRKVAIGKLSKGKITVKAYQKMFNEIYPAENRNLFEAGVHLAEEVGEINEIICWFLGEHKIKIFHEIKNEIADCMSCIFGVANSAGIDIAKELYLMFKDNCHVCHKAPCACNYTFIAKFDS